MKFSGLTKKGRLYLAKIQANGEPIQFTKIKFGDGKLSEHENPADLADIKNIKVEKSILNKEQKEDAVTLTTIIDNVGLVEGYFPRETGIYVQDAGKEILYFYMNDGDETSWLPAEVDGPHRMEMKINLISSNTGSVLVNNDGKDLYITKDYLENNYTKKGTFEGTAQDIEDRVVAAVGQLNGMFPLSEATAGNVYYHQGNKKFYICKSNYNGTTISVPNMNFEDLSIWDNRKRLENLYKIEYKTNYDVLTILNRKIVIGSLETKGATASKTLIANGFSFKNSIVMATAKKDNCSVAVIHSGDNLDFSTLDATSGNVQNGICKVDFFILLRN